MMTSTNHLHSTLAMVLIASSLVVATLAQDQACTLNCPVDAPCTMGEASYTHENFLELGADSNGMHCACPPGWTGVFCDHKYESCTDTHDCYHGGECIEGLSDRYGNGQLMCDCTNAVATDGTRYVGKYCETPFDQVCSSTDDSLFCVNGGSCNPNYETDGVLCQCDQGWEGYHCEYKQGEVPDCTLDCENGGTCVIGSNSPAEAQRMHRIWTDLEISDHMKCLCPDGFSGPTCHAQSEECGPDGDECYHGGACVTTTITRNGVTTSEYSCSCDTAGDVMGNRFAGKFCQVPSSVFCDPNDDSLFCTNGGSCNAQDPTQPCICPSGYDGSKCEFQTETYATDYTDQASEACSDVFCMNGSFCKKRDFVLENGTQGTEDYCDCVPAFVHHEQEAFAGEACQYKSTAICSTWNTQADREGLQFCVNGGTCNTGGACECPTGWTGPYCEIHTKEDQTVDDPTCGDKVCYNGGECVETKIIENGITTTDLYCDCSQAFDDDVLYAGESCEYPSTALCTAPNSDSATLEGLYFCTNHGSCKKNFHHGCECQDGFTGFSCEYLKIDEHPEAEAEAVADAQAGNEECGDYVCKNGGTCVATQIRDNQGQATTSYHCDCSTSATPVTVFAGLECEHQATVLCSEPPEGDDLASAVFCVQGGQCRENVYEGCNCPTGWDGMRCEFAATAEDILNQGQNTVECGDEVCYNGGTCSVEELANSDGSFSDVYACDCSTAGTESEFFGGPTCSSKSTSTCGPADSPFFCLNHGICREDPSQGCECPAGFTGTICEFTAEDDQHSDQGDECGDGYCYNGGTCVSTRVIGTVDDTTLQYHCDCSTAVTDSDLFAGERCEYKSTVLCSEPDGDNLAGSLFCVNGGRCLGNPELGCDCPDGWQGFYCEFEMDPADALPEENDVIACGDSVCLNGGTCVATTVVDLQGEKQTVEHCDCSTAYNENEIFSGLSCEFRATVLCTEPPAGSFGLEGVQFCTNSGQCNTENVWEGCECPYHWTGMHCQLEVQDDVDDSELCGDSKCLHGGQCIEFTVNGEVQHDCDCRGATDGIHRFDGTHCQYISTSFCSAPTGDNLNGVQFCVNEGVCQEDGFCSCPSGYAGSRCELPLYVGQDSEDEALLNEDDDRFDFECSLTCANGGQCASGVKEYGSLQDSIDNVDAVSQTYHETYYEHCECPDGFVGLTCEHKVDICGENEHFCMHGSKCVENYGELSCDCTVASADIGHGDQSSTFAGTSCEHHATDICIEGAELAARPLYFCVNEGTCKAYVTEDDLNPGCDCPEGWTGPHCELRIQASTGGLVKETGKLIAIVGVSCFLFLLLLATVTHCIRSRRTSDSGSRWFGRRRQFGTSEGIGNANLAPKRFSMLTPSRRISSSSDPITAGITLTPDDEPGAYHDDPMEPFRDELSEGYRDEPVLVDSAEKNQSENEDLQNVDFI